MPFGWTNAPATFQHLMNRIFKKLIDKGVVTVYLDDILIHSSNASEHMQHMQEVLNTLREHKLYAKMSKSEWNRSEVTFLGHLVGKDGVRMDPKKVQVIKDWPAPKTQTGLLHWPSELLSQVHLGVRCHRRSTTHAPQETYTFTEISRLVENITCTAF